MNSAIRGIIIFSAVETVILTAWLIALKTLSGPGAHPVRAAIILFVGLLIEHSVAYNVGKDRPPFAFPTP